MCAVLSKVPKTSIWSNALAFPKKNALNFDPGSKCAIANTVQKYMQLNKSFFVNASLHLICKQKCVCCLGIWNTNAISYSFDLGYLFLSLATMSRPSYQFRFPKQIPMFTSHEHMTHVLREMPNIWIARIQYVLNIWFNRIQCKLNKWNVVVEDFMPNLGIYEFRLYNMF